MRNKHGYVLIATGNDYATREFPDTEAGEADMKAWLKSHGGGHWGWTSPRSAKAIAAAERKHTRLSSGASAPYTPSARSRSRAKGYCSICRGPHVYKHGRP